MLIVNAPHRFLFGESEVRKDRKVRKTGKATVNNRAAGYFKTIKNLRILTPLHLSDFSDFGLPDLK